jgi:hypothetical protein
MPFDSVSGSKAGKIGGPVRWRNKDPETVRDRQIKITVSADERDAIQFKAIEAGLSVAELIVRACKRYRP